MIIEKNNNEMVEMNDDNNITMIIKKIIMILW
jgi:hypothetical protein